MLPSPPSTTSDLAVTGVSLCLAVALAMEVRHVVSRARECLLLDRSLRRAARPQGAALNRYGGSEHAGRPCRG